MWINADAVPSIVEGSIILNTFFLRFGINIWGSANALFIQGWGRGEALALLLVEKPVPSSVVPIFDLFT